MYDVCCELVSFSQYVVCLWICSCCTIGLNCVLFLINWFFSAWTSNFFLQLYVIIVGLGYTTALHDNFSGFASWGDLILSKFQNQFYACSAQPGQKCESGLLFGTNMPASLWVGVLRYRKTTTLLLR